MIHEEIEWEGDGDGHIQVFCYGLLMDCAGIFQGIFKPDPVGVSTLIWIWLRLYLHTIEVLCVVHVHSIQNLKKH